MKLDEIKARFRNKVKADIKDLDIALQALPFLVREIERLETEVRECEKRFDHLTLQLKKRPPLEIKGNKGSAGWEARVDEKKNRLYITLSGRFDYRNGKNASNSIINLLPSLRKGFDVISDISALTQDYEKKAVFHLRKIMHNLKETGAARIILIANPEIPELSRLFDFQAQEAGYKAFFAESVTEAETMLENVGRFLKV